MIIQDQLFYPSIVIVRQTVIGVNANQWSILELLIGYVSLLCFVFPLEYAISLQPDVLTEVKVKFRS